jgi:hypothetical protein
MLCVVEHFSNHPPSLAFTSNKLMSATCWAEGLDRPYFSRRRESSRAGSRQEKFVDECRKKFIKVWNSVTWGGETISLCSSATSLVLAFSMAGDVTIRTIQNISFAQVCCDNGAVNVLVGESTGECRSYMWNDSRTFSSPMVLQSVSPAPVQCILACGLDIWVVQDKMASLWSTGTCKLQLTLGGPANTKYLSSQVLDIFSSLHRSVLTRVAVLCSS